MNRPSLPREGDAQERDAGRAQDRKDRNDGEKTSRGKDFAKAHAISLSAGLRRGVHLELRTAFAVRVLSRTARTSAGEPRDRTADALCRDVRLNTIVLPLVLRA